MKLIKPFLIGVLILISLSALTTLIIGEPLQNLLPEWIQASIAIIFAVPLFFLTAYLVYDGAKNSILFLRSIDNKNMARIGLKKYAAEDNVVAYHYNKRWTFIYNYTDNYLTVTYFIEKPALDEDIFNDIPLHDEETDDIRRVEQILKELKKNHN